VGIIFFLTHIVHVPYNKTLAFHKHVAEMRCLPPSRW